MQVNIKQFLDHIEVQDSLYPGKRIVKPCKQIGEYKNHCVVIDWRNPEMIKIDVRPGLSGKILAPEVTKQYPVCFQMPSYVNIKVINENNKKDEDEDDEKGSKGKSGSGGGQKPTRKKKTLLDTMPISKKFDQSVAGKTPIFGEIIEMMIMGKEIAQEAFTRTFTELSKQIQHAKITMTEVLATAVDVLKRVEPPSFIKPKGDETMRYKYDREKNADIGFKMSLI